MLILELELAGKNVNICCYGNNVAKSKFKPGCQSGQKNDLASYRVTNNTASLSLSKRFKTNHSIICYLWIFKLLHEKRIRNPTLMVQANVNGPAEHEKHSSDDQECEQHSKDTSAQ